jgi:[ribosomal protein S5]-alanine N-acetyltransferase
MEHLGTKELQTERLILRRLTIEDTESVYNNWANDDEVTYYLSWPTHKDKNVTKGVLENWIKNYSKNDFYQWAIVPKAINEPIGTISVVDKNDDIQMVEIGYCIGRKWWNKGITSEALNAIIKYFFEEIKVNRIEAWHDIKNQNSGKVMAKCEMKCEGNLRQSRKNNTGISDHIIYGILLEEYLNKKQKPAHKGS